MTYPTKQINGFTAKILDQHKLVSFRHESGHEVIEVPVDGRITKKNIMDYVNGFSGVFTVYVRHYRYACYNLRNVMSQRSGEYTNVTTYELNSDNQIESVFRELKNGMY